MTTTTRRSLAALVVILAAVALAAVLILTRPDAGDRFWADFHALYPGIPASDKVGHVARAEHLCDAGAPLAWWDVWPQAPVNADYWNLAIEHLCPEHSAHRVSVTG
jgi:hypothetical protein